VVCPVLLLTSSPNVDDDIGYFYSPAHHLHAAHHHPTPPSALSGRWLVLATTPGPLLFEKKNTRTIGMNTLVHPRLGAVQFLEDH
jgi:hypothetical protein